MTQPFALENLAKKVNLSGKRATQDYFDARAKEGTEFLANIIDDLQKQASKGTGLFDKIFGKFGGAVKTGLGMVNPVLGLIAGGIDTATSQKDLKKMIKNLGKDINLPAKFRGTFLENYLLGGIQSGKGDLKNYLKGRKQTDLITGLVSTALTGITAAKGTEWGKKIADKVGLTLEETLPGKVLGNVFKSKLPNATLSVAPGKTLTKIIGSDLAAKLSTTLPLANLTTPALYTPIFEGVVQDYLIGEAEEPVISAAQAPKFY